MCGPRHSAVIDLSVGVDTSFTGLVSSVVRRLHQEQFVVAPFVYSEAPTLDPLGVIPTGVIGAVLQDFEPVPLAALSLALFSRFLTEAVRFQSHACLENAGVELSDTGEHSVPVLLEANGCEQP